MSKSIKNNPPTVMRFSNGKIIAVTVVPVIVLLIAFFWIDLSTDYSDKNRKSSLKISSEAANSRASEILEEEERSSVSFSSHQSLSPKPGEGTVLTFFFQILVPPAYDRRQRLIMHYESNKPPYAGWALALRRLPSSYRFEYYLQNHEAKGGWFSFDAMDLEIGTWYAFTLVIEPSTFLSAYLLEVPPLSEQGLVNNPALGKASQLKHLGGFPVEGLQVDQVQASLQITSGSPKIGPFKGKVEEVTILRLANLPAPADFLKDAINGPRSLLQKYPDACVLSQSKFSKNCEITANSASIGSTTGEGES